MNETMRRYVTASEALADAAWNMAVEEGSEPQEKRNPEELRRALQVLGKLGAPESVLALIRAMLEHLEAYQALPQQETRARTLDAATNEQAEARGVTVVGAQRWETVCKAYSAAEGWFKTTKAMLITGAGVLGVLVQTTTREAGGHVTDALCFIPHATLGDNGDGTVEIVSVAG